MHRVIFQTKASNGSLDASHATKPGAHPQLSDPVSLSPPVGLSKPQPLGFYAVSRLPVLNPSSALAGLDPHPAQ